MTLFRGALPGDLPALELAEGICFPVGRWTRADLMAALERPDRICRVVEGPTGLYGYALGWAGGGISELTRIAVLPEGRREGRGRALLADFHAAAVQADAEECWLEVRADNMPAQALYHREGYQPTGRRRAYYSDGTDAILMTRSLQLLAVRL